MSMLRVHSKDLHEHVVSEAGECLDQGLYTDVLLRCRDGQTLHAHRIVLAAVSPYLRVLLDGTGEEVSLELPEHDKSEVEALISIIYSGSIDASVEEIRKMLVLAHSLFISVPVSEQLNSILGLSLAPHSPARIEQFNQQIIMKSLSSVSPAAMSVLQQQLISQLALMNGLVDGQANMGQPPPSNNQQQTTAVHPAFMLQEQSMGREKNTQLNSLVNSSYQAEVGVYLCSICNSKYTNKGNFKQHVEKHVKEGQLHLNPVMQEKPILETPSNLYHCDVCNSSYNHPGNYKQHMLKHEREQRSKQERNQDTSHLNNVLQSAFADRVDNGDPSKIYVCEECNRTFKHPGNFKQHMASHNRMPVPAPPSLVNFFKRPLPGLVKMLTGDRNGNHTPAQTDWECPECKQSFDKDIELQAHMKAQHDIEMVLQPSLDPVKIEAEEENFLEDMKVSASKGDTEAIKALAMAAGEARLANFHCDVPGCYQSFTTEGWLLRHMQKQHSDLTFPDPGPRAYPCPQCGKEFSKPSKLTQHLKTHSPDSHYKYPCDICGKKFTRPQHVNRHKLLHTGERPFSCTSCGKTFAREDKLKMHVKNGCAGHDLDVSLDSREDSIMIEAEDTSLSGLSSSMEVGVVG